MKNSQLEAMRHSLEHVLTMAMIKLYPGLLPAMGPAIPEGFYFDFDYAGKVQEADFPKIEEEMQKIIQQDLPIVHSELSVDEAKKLFSKNPYKLAWAEEADKRGEKVSVFTVQGQSITSSFIDVCKGPHVTSTGQTGPFKLLSLAGAYWHGDEKNKMLTRIYGTAFPTQEELDQYREMLEEAKRRDHRKIGEACELFTISEEVGPGLILWLPKGYIIKENLEEWAKQTEKEWGYVRVATPHITKSSLFYTSGHLPYYKSDMFPPMKLDKEEYFLKPMNCPHHHMIYKSKTRSYRGLPLRLAEFGTCYRYEASGELFGLMRVRGFTQNDAHIYCTLDQAVDEFVKVMELHEYYYRKLGINNYHLEFGLRDPKKKNKYHGDENTWRLAEKLMREAVSRTKIRMVETVGAAAFYGPKIDFIIHSSIGREFAISTNQIDLYMGQRFGLKYIDKDGKEQIPAILHRAPLGSDERFIGFLIEHFAGAFPTWLAPVQVIIVPIAERHAKYGQKVLEQLKFSNVLVELDNRSETMQAKIRDAGVQKIPYILILGDREEKEGTISIRARNNKDMGVMKLARFLDKIKQEIALRKRTSL